MLHVRVFCIVRNIFLLSVFFSELYMPGRLKFDFVLRVFASSVRITCIMQTSMCVCLAVLARDAVTVDEAKRSLRCSYRFSITGAVFGVLQIIAAIIALIIVIAL